MWDQSSGSQFGQIIQSLMQQNPQVAQRLMQLMSQQRTAGIGSLQPRQGGGPMPMPLGGTPMERFGRGTDPGGSNLLARAPPGGMPRTNGPSSYGGQPPQGGMWGMQRPPMQQPQPTGGGGYNMQGGGLRPGGTTLDSYPRMGGGHGPSFSSPVDPSAGWRQAMNWMPPAGSTPQPYTPPMPMPTTDRPAAPYRAPAYTPAPFSAPAAQPKTYGAPTPAGPSLAQNGTAGLDWYAMQAGN